MTLQSYSADKFDDLATRLIEISGKFRELAKIQKQSGIKAISLNDRKLQEWMIHIEVWAQDAAGRQQRDCRREIYLPAASRGTDGLAQSRPLLRLGHRGAPLPHPGHGYPLHLGRARLSHAEHSQVQPRFDAPLRKHRDPQGGRLQSIG